MLKTQVLMVSHFDSNQAKKVFKMEDVLSMSFPVQGTNEDEIILLVNENGEEKEYIFDVEVYKLDIMFIDLDKGLEFALAHKTASLIKAEIESFKARIADEDEYYLTKKSAQEFMEEDFEQLEELKKKFGEEVLE